MFPYDAALAAAVQAPVNSIADVLRTMQTIEATCADADGLKWFNWLYLQVTSAVEKRVAAAGFADPAWLSELDVQFARLYFEALGAYLTGVPCPGCWWTLFNRRNQSQIARIQFALAGINAHINHDLPEALVATCQATGTVPRHETAQYSDYTSLNSTLDGQIGIAKQILNVRLPGDPLPPISHLEDTLAAWGTSAAREHAWNNSQALWYLRDVPAIAAAYLDSLDGLTTFGNKALLAPVPMT
jgi:hypothetical protein